jgi:hypothetical protein
MATIIRQVSTPEDRERVFRFRYDIYVEEMRRTQVYANHAAHIIEEPLDETGRIYLAEDDAGRVVGTVRSNYGCDTDFGYYEELYAMRCVGGSFPLRVSITTKLMVAPERRSSTVAARLAMAAYRDGLNSGILFDFIDCNPHMEAIFHRLGYQCFTGRIEHPEFGDALPLVLLLTDVDHLERVGSPFARICAEEMPHIDANRRMREHITAFQSRQVQVSTA